MNEDYLQCGHGLPDRSQPLESTLMFGPQAKQRAFPRAMIRPNRGGIFAFIFGTPEDRHADALTKVINESELTTAKMLCQAGEREAKDFFEQQLAVIIDQRALITRRHLRAIALEELKNSDDTDRAIVEQSVNVVAEIEKGDDPDWAKAERLLRHTRRRRRIMRLIDGGDGEEFDSI